MERPERRRREGRRSVRFAFGRRSSLFCVPVLFLYLCLLWVYVFYGFYVGPAKLQRGATPPSVMVLLTCFFMLLLYPLKGWHVQARWHLGQAATWNQLSCSHCGGRPAVLQQHCHCRHSIPLLLKTHSGEKPLLQSHCRHFNPLQTMFNSCCCCSACSTGACRKVARKPIHLFYSPPPCSPIHHLVFRF